jgi:hypothetical protein
MQTRKFTPYLQALLAAALFGLSTPLAKLLLGEMDSIVLAALLYLGSGMGALICIIALRTRSFGARLRSHIRGPSKRTRLLRRTLALAGSARGASSQ